MSSAKSDQKKIYQLKFTLVGSKPPIWRRVLVSDDISLLKLHRVIQLAMGWTNSHLHKFIIDDEYYSIPSVDEWQPVIDETEVLVSEVATNEGRGFIYEYDFGDSWEHVVLVEKILADDPGVNVPHCLKGRRACPPEDVGGVWGYEEFLDAIRDPSHEEHESFLEWVGDEFDPEYFDLEQTNQLLADIDNIVWWDLE